MMSLFAESFLLVQDEQMEASPSYLLEIEYGRWNSGEYFHFDALLNPHLLHPLTLTFTFSTKSPDLTFTHERITEHVN
jgi:hypothetical protein